ncbi:hypothetical protein DH86_00000255 [Scytalidium sp. 3C]|nr:hypothetical protein DH86_00000255 [Scytalidium sp. 3C]
MPLSRSSSDSIHETSPIVSHIDYDDNAISRCSTADAAQSDGAIYKSAFVSANRSQDDVSEGSGTGTFAPSKLWKRKWWRMSVRARRTLADEMEMEGDLQRGLLSESVLIGHKRPKSSGYWLNYCIFGGIGGLSGVSSGGKSATRRCNIGMVGRHRSCITELGQTRLGHRRSRMVSHRFSTGCTTNSLSFT